MSTAELKPLYGAQVKAVISMHTLVMW
uniref:Uncharacterized protein n=1 Tax=Arundo donax TaxID=35708 RepID=A0A0A9GQQ3_ARUDO